MAGQESSTGLVLRVRPLTETSLIIHWLTADLGRVATVAKGARGPKSSFRGKLDLFYLADFSFVRSRRSDLHTLREVVLKEPHARLRSSMGALHQASYAVTCLERTTETETPLPELYELVTGFIGHLTAHGPGMALLLGFELKMLEVHGLTPDPAELRLSAETKRWLEQLVQEDWAGLGKVVLSAPVQRELGQFLHGFLVYHYGRLPAGRALALEAATDGKPDQRQSIGG